jgi:hypothetical protein
VKSTTEIISEIVSKPNAYVADRHSDWWTLLLLLTCILGPLQDICVILSLLSHPLPPRDICHYRLPPDLCVPLENLKLRGWPIDYDAASAVFVMYRSSQTTIQKPHTHALMVPSPANLHSQISPYCALLHKYGRGSETCLQE